jgi:hypothetical protein
MSTGVVSMPEQSEQGEEHMTNLAKTSEIIEKVLRKIMEEKIEREWIGLTDEEVAMYDKRLSGSGVARDIEAKLKEKNGG